MGRTDFRVTLVQEILVRETKIFAKKYTTNLLPTPMQTDRPKKKLYPEVVRIRMRTGWNIVSMDRLTMDNIVRGVNRKRT